MLFSDSRSVPRPSHPGRCYVGLDLGQRSSHAAICAAEFWRLPTRQRDPSTYQFLYESGIEVRYLERIPLGTSYVRIAEHLRHLLRQTPFAGRATLVIEANSPGLPFIDFFSAQGVPANLIRVVTTASGKPHFSGGFHHVSRQTLIANLALLIQRGCLRVRPDLPGAHGLREELRALQQNGRSKARDDLVMATALAVWQANKHHPM
jgi:hypothetical protein